MLFKKETIYTKWPFIILGDKSSVNIGSYILNLMANSVVVFDYAKCLAFSNLFFTMSNYICYWKCLLSQKVTFLTFPYQNKALTVSLLFFFWLYLPTISSLPPSFTSAVNRENNWKKIKCIKCLFSNIERLILSTLPTSANPYPHLIFLHAKYSFILIKIL